MDRWVTPPKQVTSPTWGPPPPCKQALSSKVYTAKIEIRQCVKWSLTKGIRQREQVILKTSSPKRGRGRLQEIVVYKRFHLQAKGMSIDDGTCYVQQGTFVLTVLSAAAAEPWGNLTCSQSSPGSAIKKATASWQQTGVLVMCSVILNLQFHVALSELGSLFQVQDIRSWVSEYRIFSDKRPGAYLKFRLIGWALILCLTVTPSKMKRQTSQLLVYTWYHGDYVGGQEQEHFSPLGTKLYFHVKSIKNSIVLTRNMAALSLGCKPRIQKVQNLGNKRK